MQTLSWCLKTVTRLPTVNRLFVFSANNHTTEKMPPTHTRIPMGLAVHGQSVEALLRAPQIPIGRVDMTNQLTPKDANE